jgi:hypothetical protein
LQNPAKLDQTMAKKQNNLMMAGGDDRWWKWWWFCVREHLFTKVNANLNPGKTDHLVSS